MNSFKNIMEKIEKEQFERFQSLIKDRKELHTNHYICLFLRTFLGEEYFPESNEDFELMRQHFGNDKTAEYCFGVIDSISLCHQEITFFKQMVILRESKNYIKDCLEFYNKTEGLRNCQLGNNILKCLEASKDLNIAYK